MSPKDIRERRFSTTRKKGYCREEVDEFLDEVSGELEMSRAASADAQREAMELRVKVHDLEARNFELETRCTEVEKGMGKDPEKSVQNGDIARLREEVRNLAAEFEAVGLSAGQPFAFFEPDREPAGISRGPEDDVPAEEETEQDPQPPEDEEIHDENDMCETADAMAEAKNAARVRSDEAPARAEENAAAALIAAAEELKNTCCLLAEGSERREKAFLEELKELKTGGGTARDCEAEDVLQKTCRMLAGELASLCAKGERDAQAASSASSEKPEMTAARASEEKAEREPEAEGEAPAEKPKRQVRSRTSGTWKRKAAAAAPEDEEEAEASGEKPKKTVAANTAAASGKEEAEDLTDETPKKKATRKAPGGRTKKAAAEAEEKSAAVTEEEEPQDKPKKKTANASASSAQGRSPVEAAEDTENNG